MSERTPQEQASVATMPSLEERVAELEDRLAGVEHLLAHNRSRLVQPELRRPPTQPVLPPDTARTQEATGG